MRNPDTFFLGSFQMISKGRDMSSFFAQVVKQVASPSIEIRKLASCLLRRGAEVILTQISLAGVHLPIEIVSPVMTLPRW